MIYLLIASLGMCLSAPKYSYVEAYREAVQHDKPLLVLFSAQWCRPCQAMKRQLSAVDFRAVPFGIIDVDHRPELKVKVVPQLRLYRKVKGRWRRLSWHGYLSAKEIQRIVDRLGPRRRSDAH